MWSFTPNPPPTSGAMTLIWCWGSPQTRAMVSRTAWGAWVEVHTVSFPEASGETTMPRHSIGAPASRPIDRLVRSTWGQSSSTACTWSSVSPASNSAITLVPASG